MARFARVSLLLVGMGLMLGTVAFANVPDPVNSGLNLRFNASSVIVEPIRIVNVPANPGPGPNNYRCELEITVKDASGTLINNSTVFVIFSPTAATTLCWCATQNQVWALLGDGSRAFHAATNTSGLVKFQISAGGCLDAAGVVIVKAGAPGDLDPSHAITLRTYNSLASMDNVGPGGAVCDGVVNASDLQRYVVAHIGGAGAYGTCYDYTGDGVVNGADLQLYVQQHLRAATCF